MMDPIEFLRMIAEPPESGGCNGSVVVDECSADELTALIQLRSRRLVHAIAGLAIVTVEG